MDNFGFMKKIEERGLNVRGKTRKAALSHMDQR